MDNFEVKIRTIFKFNRRECYASVFVNLCLVSPA